MGHNLEKNLKKIQGMRAKGQLEKALKQLQDWARKHPDTPHYLYEASMVAFDMGDYGVGLTSLKNLLRAIPDTRERVLKACSQRFEERPALALGEFLVENFLAEERLDDALETIVRLDPEQLQVFARKISLKHRSMVATPQANTTLLRQSHLMMYCAAHAMRDTPNAAAAIDGLIDLQPERIDEWIQLCQRELQQTPQSDHLKATMGKALCAANRIGEGSRMLASYAARNADQAPELLERVRRLEPSKKERGRWLKSVGDLALLAGNGELAAQSYLDTADADPSLRDELLERLETMEEPTNPEALSALMKLRLRLVVVKGDYNALPPLLERIRAENMANEAEIRSLLGENQSASAEKPTALLLIQIEAALHAGDLRAATNHISQVPDHEEHSLHKILRVIEKLVPQEESPRQLEWFALLAVLQGRIGDATGTSYTLTRLWTQRGESAELFAITDSCLQKVAPTADLLAVYLPAALRASRQGSALQHLENALREGGEDEELVDALSTAVGDAPEVSADMLKLLDHLDPALGAKSKLRYPTALAALACGEYARAMPEISVLLMTQPQLAPEVTEHVNRALLESPANADLNLGAYEILAEAGEIEQAASCLGRAIAADPGRIEQLSRNFDDLLEKSPDNVELWRSYADALYSTGRFDQLGAVCQRAARVLPAASQTHFRLLQARVLVEDGRLTPALSIVSELMSREQADLDRVRDILLDVIAANPMSAQAHLLLGDACFRAKDVDEAIVAYQQAVKSDDELQASINERLQKLAALPSTQAKHLVLIANYHCRNNTYEPAAEAFARALQMDEAHADRILGDTSRQLAQPDCPVSLLLVGARAARLASNVELACDLLARVDEKDNRRFENLLSEYRKLGEAFPGELLPIRYAARVLLAHDAPDAAAQIVLDVSQNSAYDLEQRIESLREFQRKSEDPRLPLSLARLLSQKGSHDQAVQCVRDALENLMLDPEEASLVSEELMVRAPHVPQIGLLRHDVLMRAGSVNEALHALPEPASMEDNEQTEISERLAAQFRRTLADPILAHRFADSLRRQGRIEDAIRALRTAAETVPLEDAHPLWTELARTLHDAGRPQECREVLEDLSASVEDRRHFYQMFADWTSRRLHVESDALAKRLERDPDSAEVSFQLAETLLQQDRAREVPAVLFKIFSTPEQRAHRACLLARAYLDQDQVELAQAVLDPMANESQATSQDLAQIQFYLAECAGRMGRWGESHARFLDLVESPELGSKAQQRATEAYSHYLADTAGEYCAVISKVSTLAPHGESLKETT